MSRYASFVSLSRKASEADVKTASILTSAADIINARTISSEYVPNKDEDATKVLRDAKAVRIIVKTDNNGKDYNRVEVLMKNDRRIIYHLYGNDKELAPAKELTTEQIKKVEGLTCTSDGEIVTDLMNVNGTLCRVPRWYLDYRTI